MRKEHFLNAIEITFSEYKTIDLSNMSQPKAKPANITKNLDIDTASTLAKVPTSRHDAAPSNTVGSPVPFSITDSTSESEKLMPFHNE